MKGRLVTRETYPVAKQAGELWLTPDLLRKDALVFEDGISSMTLDCKKADYHLKVCFPGFPAAAVWINDFVGQGVQDIRHKYLIQSLDAGESSKRSYTIEIL